MSFFPENSNSTRFEMGGGEPIPDGTQCLAMCDEAKNDNYQGEDYISLRWVVAQPEQYKNRKVFQKLKIHSSDSKKSEKARRMLAAIDMNASGGKIVAAGRAPTDIELTQHLCLKPMVIRLGVWDMDGKTGNWVQAVSPRNPQTAAAPVAAHVPQPQTSPAYSGDIDF